MRASTVEPFTEVGVRLVRDHMAAARVGLATRRHVTGEGNGSNMWRRGLYGTAERIPGHTASSETSRDCLGRPLVNH